MYIFLSGKKSISFKSIIVEKKVISFNFSPVNAICDQEFHSKNRLTTYDYTKT